MFARGIESIPYNSTLQSRAPFSYGSAPSEAQKTAQFLAQKGYNPNEFKDLMKNSEEIRKKRLGANLETMITHVFEDSVVSRTNYYQMKGEEVVSFPDGTPLSIDPDERGGKYKIGIESAVWGALTNPNEVVLLYSPPGVVVFDDNPNNKFKNIKPYTQGQVYIMYSDGDKVHNVAVSTSGKDETFVAQIMPEVYKIAQSKKNEVEKISYFVTTPSLTGASIDTFLENVGKLDDSIIFTNKDGIEYSVHQTLSLLQQSLANLLPHSHIVEDILKNIDVHQITEDDIHHIYGNLAQRYMKEKGIQSMLLGGSCGGIKTDFDPLSDNLNNLSASYRLITQGLNELNIIKDPKKDPNLCRCSAASGRHFHCPGKRQDTKEPCLHAIEVGHGISTCPVCGTGKTC